MHGCLAERQVVVLEVVDLYASELLGDAPGQVVASEEQIIQIGEVAQLGRYRAGQLVIPRSSFRRLEM